MAGLLENLKKSMREEMDQRMGPLRAEMQKMNKTLTEILKVLKEQGK